MKVRYLIIYMCLLICLAITGTVGILFSNSKEDNGYIDGVTVNRFIYELADRWQEIQSEHCIEITSKYEFDYTVIDENGNVLEYTRSGISDDIAKATMHGDLIRDISVEGKIVGKVIINSEATKIISNSRKENAKLFFILSIGNIIVTFVYSIFIYKNVIKPFKKMNKFASSVAAGNLDIELERDKYNIFGSFTESFDIMREQLLLAREKEAEAKTSQKELVAQLSHDIKTPVSSIKAMSEVMLLTANSDNEKNTLNFIVEKTDQIDNLVSNLFHATLEELEQLSVNVEEISSVEIEKYIKESDYLHKIEELHIEDCMVMGDRLRVKQIFGNIITNSYKYANSRIEVNGRIDNGLLMVDIKDYGPGVAPGEAMFLKQKFRRGTNAKNIKGTGLGLYISNYLCEKMEGTLICDNWEQGFLVIVGLKML